MTSTTAPAAATTAQFRDVRWLGTGVIFTLLAQLLLGIANSLWLNVPATGNAWKTATPGALLGAHLLVGTALALFALWLIVVAVRAKDRTWTVASVVGIVGILLGFGGGAAFLGSNGQAAPSMVMAVGCTVAIASYVLALAKR